MRGGQSCGLEASVEAMFQVLVEAMFQVLVEALFQASA